MPPFSFMNFYVARATPINVARGALALLIASCVRPVRSFFLSTPTAKQSCCFNDIVFPRLHGRVGTSSVDGLRRRRTTNFPSSRWAKVGVEGSPAGRSGGMFDEELGALDAEQAAMMAEECIIVDREDQPTGSASKVETHLISKGLLLHRAFSVFLFDSRGRLLLQKRASSKHTFPDFWTNSCCSHPLSNPNEMGLDMTVEAGVSSGLPAVVGARRAAVRKLGQELGIPAAQLPPEMFTFLTKVHYKASSGEVWGEHEIDYIFVAQADIDLDPNPNEVSEAIFLDREGLSELLAESDRGEISFTPWSRYIIDNFLYHWWDHLGKSSLEAFRDDKIHRVGECVLEERGGEETGANRREVGVAEVGGKGKGEE